MNSEINTSIVNAIQSQFYNAQVRVENSEWGYFLEVIHYDESILGHVLFRREVTRIFNSITNDRLFRLFEYSKEEHRYLQQATLRALPRVLNSNGEYIVHCSEQDYKLYIHEFDCAYITEKNYTSHKIPSIVQELNLNLKEILLPTCAWWLL